MIFSFLKYLSPVWYFNLKPRVDHGYFPTKELLDKHGVDIQTDISYVSIEARERDLAYRAFQMGFIDRTANEEMEQSNFWKTIALPVEDEYRFIRKNFSLVWVVYVLLIRLFSLNNPFKEISGFWRSRNAERVNYHLNSVEYSDYKNFESSIVKENPLVSVIIPTLNRYPYLKDVFRDLEKQTYQNFEVIVVDQSEPFDPKVYEGWDLDLKYWYQEEKALWKARNDAIQVAKGGLILLYDDDSLVEPDWIMQHIKTLDYFNADISSGVSLSTVGAKIPAHYAYFRWSDQLDTGNVLIKKIVFEKIGLFDRQFEKQRMGDGEFGLRAYLNGFRNISNPFAKRIHLKVGEGGLRQMGSWDELRPKKILDARPIPSVTYFYLNYFPKKIVIYTILKFAWLSMIPYSKKGDKLSILLLVFLTPILAPFIVFSVTKSWSSAKVKVKNGPVIYKLG